MRIRRSSRASEIIDPISATTAQNNGRYRRWVNEWIDSPSSGRSASTATASRPTAATPTAHRRQDHQARWCGG